MKNIYLALSLIFSAGTLSAQQFLETNAGSEHWVDSTFRKLSRREKIAQLMVLRVSTITANGPLFYEEQVAKNIRKYNTGALCLFQGTSKQQAEVLNRLQAKAKTPLMVCVDGETGVGMRFSDVSPFPDQLTIGATPDAALAYNVGKEIAAQCKRIGIHVNYAPVVDINNNPDNPVINYRSFGEDKYKVAGFGVQIMKGMQDGGVMACAKHFPGHGDVAVDSHFDLPVINKSLQALDSLEMYPFKELIRAGVGSMMMAHLYIPVIDSTLNKATSLSHNNVTGILREQLGFKGLAFTDGLGMKGVSKFYPQGEASARSIIAGNDMLCLPQDVKGSIKKTRKAIRRNELQWTDIDEKVKKVLLAKYNLGLNALKPVDTTALAADLNRNVQMVKKEVYLNAITLLRQSDSLILPLKVQRKVAYVGIGISGENHFGTMLKNAFAADCFYLDYTADSIAAGKILTALRGKYDEVIVGLHKYKKYPANNFGISTVAMDLVHAIQKENKVLNFIFGNPYAVKNYTDARNIVVCYEDDNLMHEAALSLLKGGISAKGRLPVSVEGFHYGTGLSTAGAPSVKTSVFSGNISSKHVTD